MAETDSGAVVSVERDGRILSGGPGSDVEAMESALESASPAPATADRSGEARDAPAAAETEPLPPKPSRGAKRFDQLTGEREQARREAQDATQRALQLEERLKALETRQSPPEPVQRPSEPIQRPAAPAARAKPLEAEVGVKYPTYADFVEDLSDWKAEQRISQLDFDARIRQSIEADRASRSLADRWQQTTASARQVYADFDAVVSTGPGANIPLASDPKVADERVMMLVNTPGGEHVIYQLAKNAAETQRLSRLSDRDFGFAVARLLPAEASVASPASTGLPRAVVAPPPYQPVGAGGKTTASTLDETTKRATVNGTIDYDAGPREFFARQRTGGRRR